MLSFSISHGLHLVVPTHPCFFWVACHSSRTFPPKEPEQEPQNRFFFSLPTARPYPLTHDLPIAFSTRYSVCALSLSLSLSLPLMAGTWWFQLILVSFGWYVIPTGHFPRKNLSKNPKIGFFLLPTARPCPLTHDPLFPILARYRLVVPRTCACFTFFNRRSCICHVLEIGLYVLPCTFGFLWCGLFSDLLFFMTCFFWGLGLVGSWAFLPPAYFVFTPWPC